MTAPAFTLTSLPDRPCDEPDCVYEVSAALEGADGAQLVACITHSRGLGLDWLTAYRGPAGTCQACGAVAERLVRVVLNDAVGDLCAPHALALFDRSLLPNAFARLAAAWGGNAHAVHLLSENFYDASDGYAYSPGADIGTSRLRAALVMLTVLPSFDNEGESFVTDPAWLAFVREDYKAATGLDITEDLAREIVNSALIHEARARRRRVRRPNAEDRAWIAQRLHPILVTHDPLGLAQTGGSDPYVREARHAAGCIHGDAKESPSTLRNYLRINLLGPSSIGEPVDDRDERWVRLAHEVYTKVSLPLRKRIAGHAS